MTTRTSDVIGYHAHIYRHVTREHALEGAGKLHVRICEGGAGWPSPLLDQPSPCMRSAEVVQ